MCCYSCSRLFSCSCFVLCVGPILVLPIREQLRRCAPRCNVFSSPALQTTASPVVSPPLLRQVKGQCLQMSRPWREVKSRRGAPKRIDTQGFACPNRNCPYFGITDAHIHALVGDGTHGRLERIQTFRCQACCTTFTCPSPHPLVPAENPFPPDRRRVSCASRRAGCFRRRT